MELRKISKEIVEKIIQNPEQIIEENGITI